MNNARDVLIFYSLYAKGDWDHTLDLLRTRKALPDPVFLKRIIEPYQGKAITILDDAYPLWLHGLIKPPFVIFYEGDFSLLSNPERLVSVLAGPDVENEYAIQKTKDIVSEATEGGAIFITGLSKGSQQAALGAALEKGPAILVLGNGLKRYYPADGKELQEKARAKGLVISFYADDEQPSPVHMRERNCFLGQANKMAFVPSCRLHDGSLLSLTIALRQGRDVGCLPYPAGGDCLNNQFISQGASLVEKGWDILFDLGMVESDWEGK